MKNKVDSFLDAIYGNKSKGRWKKIILTIVILISVIFMFLFLLLNVGYNDRGLYVKPPEVRIDLKNK